MYRILPRQELSERLQTAANRKPTDSGSVSEGSNPSPAALRNPHSEGFFFIYHSPNLRKPSPGYGKRIPDLICLLDSERATGITTERLRYGQRVTAIGIPTPEIMRSEEALRVWGPAAFGYDNLGFHPLEQRFADYYSQHGVPVEKEKYLEPTPSP